MISKIFNANLVLIAFLCNAGHAELQQIDGIDMFDLPAADVYVLGEVHDNPIHHDNQAIAILAIQPKAIVFEMLSEQQALSIRPELFESEPDLRAALDWDNSGWPDFDMYFPVFSAAKGALLYGAAVDRDLVRQAVSDGAAKIFGDGAALFKLDRVLDDEEQGQREEGQLSAHCGVLPMEMMHGMVEAQRLRDASLARATYAAWLETGGPVVVITGNGHARLDWGFPTLLDRLIDPKSVLSIAQFEDQPTPDVPFNLWLVTDAATRPDPCEAFTSK